MQAASSQTLWDSSSRKFYCLQFTKADWNLSEIVGLSVLMKMIASDVRLRAFVVMIGFSGLQSNTSAQVGHSDEAQSKVPQPAHSGSQSPAKICAPSALPTTVCTYRDSRVQWSLVSVLHPVLEVKEGSSDGSQTPTQGNQISPEARGADRAQETYSLR